MLFCAYSQCTILGSSRDRRIRKQHCAHESGFGFSRCLCGGQKLADTACKNHSSGRVYLSRTLLTRWQQALTIITTIPFSDADSLYYGFAYLNLLGYGSQAAAALPHFFYALYWVWSSLWYASKHVPRPIAASLPKPRKAVYQNPLNIFAVSNSPIPNRLSFSVIFSVRPIDAANARY